jgi:hypothetical protein
MNKNFHRGCIVELSVDTLVDLIHHRSVSRGDKGIVLNSSLLGEQEILEVRFDKYRNSYPFGAFAEEVVSVGVDPSMTKIRSKLQPS